MAEERAQTPFSDMMAFWTNWQKMMWQSFEMMMNAPAFSAGLGKAFESSTGLHEQIQKNFQAGLRAMALATTEDLRPIAADVSAVQAQLDAIKGAVETIEKSLRFQEEWRKGVDQTIRQLAAFQDEGRQVIKTWTAAMDERLREFQRRRDETTKD